MEDRSDTCREEAINNSIHNQLSRSTSTRDALLLEKFKQSLLPHGSVREEKSLPPALPELYLSGSTATCTTERHLQTWQTPSMEFVRQHQIHKCKLMTVRSVKGKGKEKKHNIQM
ncbi:hypothetical protein PVAP13_2NG222015 [Panicum virgatum]|uniref:Uncharacterized protein n=1 Tax=Panicum virgatum TaxID=38727 RepID=A0A8T0VPK9_PANVG|nr:hypothetical protein PVAP13_2NG222015 [Panicum virgatum]